MPVLGPRGLGWPLAVVLACSATCRGSGGGGSDTDPDSNLITIDGDLADWRGTGAVVRLGEDRAADGQRSLDLMAAPIAASADIVRVDAAESATHLYFLLTFAGALPPDGKARYALYLDVDSRSETGFSLNSGAIGADFVALEGNLLAYAGTMGTDWAWSPAILGVKQAAPAEGRELELSIERSKIGALRAGQKVRVLIAGIDAQDPETWMDDITDYFPDLAKPPSSLSLRAAGRAATPRPSPLPVVSHIQNYLIYYGAWDRTIVERANEFHLVVLASNSGPTPAEQAGIIRQLRAGKNGRLGDRDDVVVLGYVSMGEDVRTFNNAEPLVGDGSGPGMWDQAAGRIVYQHKGVAAYYLDERKSRDHDDYGHDGQPDRHGTWGACYVDPGHPEYQAHLIGADGRADTPYSGDALLEFMEYDGLFLDTPEVADPWTGYGYTAQGMHELIKLLDETYPNKVLLLNRGLFFFMPQYPHQYKWTPRRHIDLLLYESHYLDSNYHCNAEGQNCCNEDKSECTIASIVDGYNVAPFVPLTKNYSNPKVQAEIFRPDSTMPVVSLDYAARPDAFAQEFPDIFQEVVKFSVLKYGRIELITDRWLNATPRLIIDYKPPPDLNPPEWATARAASTGSTRSRQPFYAALGSEAWGATTPRVGLQKAIPGDGKVALRWDVAHDQTRPVRYNVYYSEKFPFDFDTARQLANVRTEIGGDYATDRSFSSYDDACPYEFTVADLEPNRTFYFAVRAEDATANASGLPAGARTGPGGGIEDTNEAFLAAATRVYDPTIAIAIDGAFSDWDRVPRFEDKPGPDRIAWTSARITDDDEAIYLSCSWTGGPVKMDGRYLIFLNADQRSFTGHVANKGADFLIQEGWLLRYAGGLRGTDWKWEQVAPVEIAQSGGQAEIRIAKSLLEGLGAGINVFFAADNGPPLGGGPNRIDYMPDHGTAGYSYTLMRPPSPPAP